MTTSEVTEGELIDARRAAIDAEFAAEEMEAAARKARRLAASKMRHYESLLLIHQGQMVLPYGEGES